jgi:hypothetical protein
MMLRHLMSKSNVDGENDGDDDHPNLQQQLSSKQRRYNHHVPTVHIVTTDLNQQA